jgi:hypothetical protein
MTQKWEYAVVGMLDKKELDALGRDGWEAVGIAQTLTGSTAGGPGLSATKVVVLMKRPIH